MKIKELDIENIKPNTWNPNRIYQDKFDILVNHIQKGGMKQPILVRKKENYYEIIDGFHRYEASKIAGLKKINCVIIDVNEKEAQKITLSMNKLRGENDPQRLEELIKIIIEDEDLTEILDDIGYTKLEIHNILNKDGKFDTESALSEWKDMPEFTNKNLSGFKNLIVHFKTQADVDDFSKLIDQSIGPKTKFIWHPKQIQEKSRELIYENES